MKKLTLLCLSLATLAVTATGCGSGGGESRPPVAPGTFTVTGQVLTVTTVAAVAAARGASAAGDSISSSQPVAGAAVSFVGDNGSASPTTALTDNNGNFTLTVQSAKAANQISGTVRARLGNRVLEGFFDPSKVTNVAIPLNLTLSVESTVANRLRNHPELANVPYERIIQLVQIGEAGDYAQAVIDAFAANTSISASVTTLGTSIQEVAVLNTTIENTCAVGQTWCVTVSRLKAVNGVTTARILVVKEKASNAGGGNAGTVGAGNFTIQWPTGNALESLALGSGLSEDDMGYDVNLSNEQHNSAIAFIHKSATGISATTQVFKATLSGPVPANPETTKAIVVSQKLLGVLNESRSSSRAVAVAN